MNATTHTPNPTPVEVARIVQFAAPARQNPLERDFGTGYGKSSGYASNRRYTTDWAGPRFRVA
ncbi:hypothetical protein DWG18_14130 [Lysobacter sp. TY2-98]|uniref:hypothetical protein n=1 Tax=Lysobacter sp. TY2-98 TaxID=2290922 RepID=UPI000E204754|nr:hypothetical protein [Lysobacter sp. TY2-98]AXK73303.1 hypothetical protein DWG18_14130 [Lysobacter sp. TY2-98]